MSDSTSQSLLERARRRIPGGVNSPVRAFNAVGGSPVFIREAAGPYLIGADGRKYVDYVGSFGPMILGHAHPSVVGAVIEAARKGFSYGAPTEGEIEIAEAIHRAVPSMEMVRLVSSGTEAVMGALRAARGFTQRDLVVKCAGAYHGGADYLLVKAGSGATTLGEPDSAGVPAAIAGTTAVIPYNDVSALETIFAKRGSEIAAVIVEPVAGNMGLVPPLMPWLRALRDTTSRAQSLLVFDEVMTGFRVAYGGAQSLYGIRPDLTTIGKIVGGGLPVGAYGGRREIMERVAPLGPVYQAGTLSGNPLAVAAGLATLRELSLAGTYEKLETISAQVEQIFVDAAHTAGVACSIQRVGSMLTPFFTDSAVRSWDDADRCDRRRFARFHQEMLAASVYWPPSQFEAGFVSLAHSDEALETTRRAAHVAFAAAALTH